jgi:hypothetical protein
LAQSRHRDGAEECPLLGVKRTSTDASPENFEEVVKLETEFMGTQMNSFNEQAKVVSEIYTKAAEDAMKTPFGVRK